MTIGIHSEALPAIFRPENAARYIGVSRSYFYLLAKRGGIPLFKLGRKASGVLRVDLDAWLNEQRRQVSPSAWMPKAVN